MEGFSCLVNPVFVNYAVRFSSPVTALAAPPRPVWCHPTSSASSVLSPGIKTHSSPAAFPTSLSLSFCSLPLSHLPCTAPSCLRPLRAPLTPLPGALVPTEPIRRGQWEKCRSATADSYSLDASATLSRRPLTVTPMKRPAFGQVTGDLVMRRPQMHDPLFKLRPPIHHTSCLHRGRPRPR